MQRAIYTKHLPNGARIAIYANNDGSYTAGYYVKGMAWAVAYCRSDSGIYPNLGSSVVPGFAAAELSKLL